MFSFSPQCWFLIYISHICCYTQLACILIRKISHLKNTLKFACKKFACKGSRKNLHASFLHGLFMEICHIARNLRMCKCCNAHGLYCKYRQGHGLLLKMRNNCIRNSNSGHTYPLSPPPHPSRRFSSSFWGKSNFALYSSPFQDHVICWTIYSKWTFVVFCSLLARNLFSSTAFHQDLS